MKKIKHSIFALVFLTLFSACGSKALNHKPLLVSHNANFSQYAVTNHSGNELSQKATANANATQDTVATSDNANEKENGEDENGEDDFFAELEQEYTATEKNNPDPFEKLNRKTHAFNDYLDRNILRPSAVLYKKTMPSPLNRGVDNFIANLGEPNTILNDILQLKFGKALADSGRLLINSTLGLAGFIDVASSLGIEKRKEDFGQTLGHWGVKSGPYIVLPFLGPSTLRDGLGRIPDSVVGNEVLMQLGIETFEHKLVYIALYGVNFRQKLLDYDSIISQSGADPYLFMRDAYLQNRAMAIRDGKATSEELISAEDEFIFAD